MIQRPRRLRRSEIIRNMVAETTLHRNRLVMPYFVSEAQRVEPIQGFSGQNRYGIDDLSRKIECDLDRGLVTFLLFGSTSQKDDVGSRGVREDSSVVKALVHLKKRFGKSINLISDVCLCPYTSHGHCGVVSTEIDNDPSLELLSKMALLHAEAGADMVAPSDMMDGRVGAIRSILDKAGLTGTGILSYSAKYASHYYGPFREALGSFPKGVSRASYQMDFRNKKEAVREVVLDEGEGADIVMVKPALAYLDIISRVKEVTKVPVAAYSVSGEYQMVKLLAQSGMADEQSLALENLIAISRAGADIIVTYFASEAVEKGWL